MKKAKFPLLTKIFKKNIFLALPLVGFTAITPAVFKHSNQNIAPHKVNVTFHQNFPEYKLTKSGDVSFSSVDSFSIIKNNGDLVDEFPTWDDTEDRIFLEWKSSPTRGTKITKLNTQQPIMNVFASVAIGVRVFLLNPLTHEWIYSNTPFLGTPGEPIDTLVQSGENSGRIEIPSIPGYSIVKWYSQDGSVSGDWGEELTIIPQTSRSRIYGRYEKAPLIDKDHHIVTRSSDEFPLHASLNHTRPSSSIKGRNFPFINIDALSGTFARLHHSMGTYAGMFINIENLTLNEGMIFDKESLSATPVEKYFRIAAGLVTYVFDSPTTALTSSYKLDGRNADGPATIFVDQIIILPSSWMLHKDLLYWVRLEEGYFKGKYAKVFPYQLWNSPKEDPQFNKFKIVEKHFYFDVHKYDSQRTVTLYSRPDRNFPVAQKIKSHEVYNYLAENENASIITLHAPGKEYHNKYIFTVDVPGFQPRINFFSRIKFEDSLLGDRKVVTILPKESLTWSVIDLKHNFNWLLKEPLSEFHRNAAHFFDRPYSQEEIRKGIALEWKNHIAPWLFPKHTGAVFNLPDYVEFSKSSFTVSGLTIKYYFTISYKEYYSPDYYEEFSRSFCLNLHQTYD